MALEWYCGAGGRTHVVHLASGKHTKNYGKPTFSVGQPALFMAILNSYMKLPEGKCYRVSKVFFFTDHGTLWKCVECVVFSLVS